MFVCPLLVCGSPYSMSDTSPVRFCLSFWFVTLTLIVVLAKFIELRSIVPRQLALACESVTLEEVIWVANAAIMPAIAMVNAISITVAIKGEMPFIKSLYLLVSGYINNFFAKSRRSFASPQITDIHLFTTLLTSIL